MEASPSLPWPPIVGTGFRSGKSTANLVLNLKRRHGLIGKRRITTRASAIGDPSGAVPAAPAQAEVTWQIIVGALAGVAPFVIAGIEFSKRIITQKRCEACGGTGLVLRGQDYFRCPSCGGFLPWQSWKRFFTG